MKHAAQLCFVVPLVVLLAACGGAKSLAKKGAKLEEAGLYAEAADMYLQALQRDQRNVEAKIGLKKNGQQVLNDKLGRFFRAVNGSNDKAEAVGAYIDARTYADRAQRLGVTLDIPEHQRQEFERVKGEHLVDLYTRGQDELDRQDFKAAETTFRRIAELEPGYKDASSLQSIAYLEPLYRAGKTDLEAGRFRRAYEEFSRIIEKDPGYKDAAMLRQEALSKGQYAIAVLPFTSQVRRNDLAGRFQAYAITALTENRDPFLRVVDRENIERILEEQRLGLSGVVDEQTAVRVGNLIGAQAVLMGNVIDYREEPGQRRQSTKDGFEAYQAREKNPETGEFMVVTRYRPVKYQEFLQESRVVVSMSYKLVSLETGEVLLSRVVDDTASDRVYYASYDGNKDALLPRTNGVVDASDRARRQLQSLLSAPREGKPMATLSNDLMRRAASTMADHVRRDMASKLP